MPLAVAAPVALPQTPPQASQTPPAGARVKAPPPAPGPVAQALTAMAVELGGASKASMPLHQRFDSLLQFRHTPATAAKLARIYGGATPWTLSRQPNGAGADGWHYRGLLSALQFKDVDGSTVEWAPAVFDFVIGGDDRTLTVSGAWPQLTASDKSARMTVRDVKVSGRQARSSDDLWFGESRFDIGSVAVDLAAPGQRFEIDGISMATSMIDRGANVDLGYELGMRRVTVAGESIDNFRLATRVTAIDRAGLLELQALQERKQAGAATGTPEQQREQARQAMLPALQALARGAVRKGTALEIDELSASYHGQTLRASGRVALEGALEADLDNPAALLKKIVAHFTVKAPMALLREVANGVARLQVRAKNKAEGSPREVAQLAGSLNDIMLGKLISNGYARVEGDVLVADIEFNAARGGLRINGKAVALPALPTGAGAPPLASASPQMMQARRIDARCALPDYPADVVKSDAPLKLAMRLLVKADGSVRNVTLAASSGRPDYDQAVLAAAAGCVYIPALRNGQPVDTPVLWKVEREPGTTHP